MFNKDEYSAGVRRVMKPPARFSREVYEDDDDDDEMCDCPTHCFVCLVPTLVLGADAFILGVLIMAAPVIQPIDYFHIFVTQSTVVLGLVAYFRAALGDPGHIKPDWRPNDSVYPGKIRYCKPCNNYKPPRAHHCSECKQCVLRMDHHCDWISNCVGLGNHKMFILFLFFIGFSCAYALLMGSWKMYSFCLSRWTEAMQEAGCAAVKNGAIIFLLVGGILAIFGLLFTCFMLCDQLSLIWRNTTEVEQAGVRRARRRGQHYDTYNTGSPLENFKEVMGQNVWTWFVPTYLKDAPKYKIIPLDEDRIGDPRDEFSIEADENEKRL